MRGLTRGWRYLASAVGAGCFVFITCAYAAGNESLMGALTGDLKPLEVRRWWTDIGLKGGGLFLAAMAFLAAWKRATSADRQAQAAIETASAALRNSQLAERGYATDRFTRAVDQVGVGIDQLSVSVGGLYALEQLLADAPDQYYWPIVELLSVVVRDDSNPGTLDRANWDGRVRVALSILGRREVLVKLERERINLSGVHAERVVLKRSNFPHAQFDNGKLTGADFEDAHLDKASFVKALLGGAHFENAKMWEVALRKATLADAVLNGAHLDRADLSEIDGRKAVFTAASLVKVNFQGADLASAFIDRCSLNESILEGASLTMVQADMSVFDNVHASGADFSGACLNGASFRNANLRNANMSDCKLRGADFSGADVTGATFLGADLTGVRGLPAVTT